MRSREVTEVPGRTVLDASFHRNSGPARNLRPGKPTSRIDVNRSLKIVTVEVAVTPDQATRACIRWPSSSRRGHPTNLSTA